MLDNLKNLFSSKHLKIENFIESIPNLTIDQNDKKVFIVFKEQITKNEINKLLEEF